MREFVNADDALQQEEESDSLSRGEVLDGSDAHDPVQALCDPLGIHAAEQLVEESGECLFQGVSDGIAERVLLLPQESGSMLGVGLKRSRQPCADDGVLARRQGLHQPPSTLVPHGSHWFLRAGRARTKLVGQRILVFVRQRKNQVLTALIRSMRSSYTQPVGFGRPATLHAPLAGPEGNRSYIFCRGQPVSLHSLRIMGAILNSR